MTSRVWFSTGSWTYSCGNRVAYYFLMAYSPHLLVYPQAGWLQWFIEDAPTATKRGDAATCWLLSPGGSWMWSWWKLIASSEPWPSWDCHSRGLSMSRAHQESFRFLNQLDFEGLEIFCSSCSDCELVNSYHETCMLLTRSSCSQRRMT